LKFLFYDLKILTTLIFIGIIPPHLLPRYVVDDFATCPLSKPLRRRGWKLELVGNSRANLANASSTEEYLLAVIKLVVDISLDHFVHM
jgi:hypothetical protein